MKLWLVKQKENLGYDTYDSFVVVAESQEASRLYHPLEDTLLPPDHELWDRRRGTWTHWSKVSSEYLGEARPGMPVGIVCSSYNAG